MPIVVDMDRTLYRSQPGLNPSSIASGLIGTDDIDPRLIRDAMTQVERERTAATQDAMDRGTLAHLALLQPERLEDSVAVWHGGRRQGGEWDTFTDANVGKLVLKQDDYRETMRKINLLRSDELVASKLRDVSPEVAMFTAEGPTACKGQVDSIHVGRREIVDIKTTNTELSQRAVDSTIRRFCYREKMALYRRWIARETGSEPEEWRCYNLFLGIGSHVGVRLVQLSTAALEWGEERMLKGIARYAECVAANDWPIYSRSDMVSVENWEIGREEEMEIDYA